MHRRRFLHGALLLPAWPARAAARAAPADAPARFVGAWDDDAGAHHLGLLAEAGGALRVVRAIELPTRAHGLALEPDGRVLAAARRPGEWLLRWTPASGAAQWCWAAADRRLTGHLLRSADGAMLWSAETDLATGQGLVGVRDARSFALRAEWPTHGIDPHQMLLDTDGSLLVANGGVPTRPETGRAKVELDRMDASLLRLDAATGARLGQWRLDDPRLSIRHLARGAGGTVGIALQAEHDDADAQAGAPVLALFDGRRPRAVEAPIALAGYGGDIAADARGFLVSAPRAGGVARYAADGGWRGLVPLAEGCALATHRGGVWAGGRDEAVHCADDGGDRGDDRGGSTGLATRHATRLATAALRLDNHWLALPRA